MNLYSLSAALAAAALLAGCATKPPPAPQPATPRPQVSRPAPPPPPAPAQADWSLLPLSSGDWVYRTEASGSQARFGPANGEASFVLRCEKARRQIVLSREGSSAATQLTLRSSTTARTVPANLRNETLAYVSAILPASDPLLDALVFSRGRFTVEAPGMPMLIIPAWPEPARVVEDCRD